MNPIKTILGIESSCDETAASVLDSGKVLSNRIASQVIHEKYGGVVPELAARAHQANIISVVDSALKDAGKKGEEIDAIAVTQGPGLLGALLVGTAFANGLSMARGIPIVGVHHTKAHILANFLEAPYPKFPFLGLVVSGGHTQLIEVINSLEMNILGSTRDDAVGEAFDKIAKMLGMPYPGGAEIDRCAASGDALKFRFPKSKVAGLDFSFSGIKTAFLYFLQKKKNEEPDFLEHHRNDLCASIQATLVDMVLIKVRQAMEQHRFTRMALGGGVANNSLLRKRLIDLGKAKNWEIFIPSPEYCTDNGAMIAVAGYHALQQGVSYTDRYVSSLSRMAF